MALESESSWLVDLPDYLYDLADEYSARGYLANLLKQKARSSFRLKIKGERISIVDK
jgi:hypothetical protein